MQFTHLHVHSQFSLLDGAASISDMMKKAKNDGMKGLALTDHGNMFGAFKFVAEADKNGLKPIVGCEFYLVENRHEKTFGKGKKDVRHHQLLLAKNKEGYKNLAKLCSLGFIEGYYSKYPRIDKELLLKYHEGLIATSCCIGAEIPQTILHHGEEKAEEMLKWWIDLFGEDYYIELQRHHLTDLDGTGKSQEDINQSLLRLAKKYNLKVIATNDSHYVNEEDWNAHDILLCINTGSKKSDPTNKGGMMVEGKEENAGKQKFRFAFPNSEFYFKTQEQMTQLFSDVPFAIDNTNEIFDKVEHLKLKRDILLPAFPLPPQFATQDDFLRHLAFQGAQRKYGSITAEIEERLNLELQTIQKMGFPGYFLIVQDFINAARNIGVSVGPGRGSAAGSVVAYCTGITNIDPIRYNLLFERFLNPERVSMPDIDVDFDDEGRQRVIDYVVDKYGKNQVAQIITYGTMAAKMSIKDVARVLDLPLDESNALAKLVPEKPGISLKQAFEEVAELSEIKSGKDLKATVLSEAQVLEGSVRNTGIHAAGVIIAPADLTDYIPVCTSKDSDLWITQFDGKYIEDAGMLKMDFLGLKTLTIIKDAIKMIEKNHGVSINTDDIPLDDVKTYELYQRGDTVGTFQFESDGMRKYLKQLKPTNIEDLIAMNALYRPGPMDYIPLYIERKHGREQVEYPHELLRPILEPTFGIFIYQEQIMQAAQRLAGYTLGGADLLRRAMGKKNKAEMDKQRSIFVEGAGKVNNIPAEKASEIFDVMEKFASYGFNRSHSAAYSVVAFHTAYLKAHYPAEYMASVLTHNMSNIEKITFFIEECRYLGVPVLGPDLNESETAFGANKKGQIRFGLGAIKGFGEAAVSAIMSEREKKGYFKNVFDLVERVDAVNKKAIECLAYSGALDFDESLHRAQYFHTSPQDGIPNIEKIIKYRENKRKLSSSLETSLWGGGGGTKEELPLPKLADCDKWSELEKLNKEREVIGFFLSGHPLDQYKLAIKSHCNADCASMSEPRFYGREVAVAGILSDVTHRTTKNGKPFAMFTLEDYAGSYKMALFGEEYLKHKHLLAQGQFVFVKGKSEERYNEKGVWEFRPKVIQLLADLQVKQFSEVRLKVDIRTLTPELIDDLQSLFERNKGNQRLKINLFDAEEKIDFDVFSGKYKINATAELIAALENMHIQVTPV